MKDEYMWIGVGIAAIYAGYKLTNATVDIIKPISQVTQTTANTTNQWLNYLNPAYDLAQIKGLFQ